MKPVLAELQFSFYGICVNVFALCNYTVGRRSIRNPAKVVQQHRSQRVLGGIFLTCDRGKQPHHFKQILHGLVVSSPTLIQGFVYNFQSTVGHEVRNPLPDGSEIYRVKILRLDLHPLRLTSSDRSGLGNCMGLACLQFLGMCSCQSAPPKAKGAPFISAPEIFLSLNSE